MSDARVESRQSIVDRRAVLAVVLLLVLNGCSLFRHPRTITDPVELLAVLPIERAEPAAPAIAPKPDEHADTTRPSADVVPSERVDTTTPSAAVMPTERAHTTATASAASGPHFEPGAERVVTAQIYGVLSSSSQWRFVPDLTAAQALPKVPASGDLVERARALGKAVGADAVLCGTVSRYVERVGSEYGARQPAAVAFTLLLVSVSSGKILWKGSFDQVQQPLTSNLFNWWQFWRGGPKWFTAEEFARLGIEHLLADLARQLGIG